MQLNESKPEPILRAAKKRPPERLGPSSIVGYQLLMGLVCCLASLGFGLHQGVSALIGWATAAVPTAYWVWGSSTSLDAVRILRQGVLKFVFSCSLMVIAIVTLEIDALAFVVGIVAAQSGHLWALFGTVRETEV